MPNGGESVEKGTTPLALHSGTLCTEDNKGSIIVSRTGGGGFVVDAAGGTKAL
jgi:hypothetical protein